MPKQNIYNNSYTVTYPDFPGFDIPPDTVKIIQKPGHQDIVEFSYTTLSNFYEKALKPGSLVKLDWKNTLSQNTFFGQVLSVIPTTNVGIGKPTVIKAIGTGLLLKENEPKIWVNKKATQIVQEIAKKVKLKPILVDTKPILTQESMVGQTYWEKLRNLADKSGYVFHVYGTELCFLPFDIMINRFMGNIPILELETTYTLGTNMIETTNLFSFTAENNLLPPKIKHSNRTKNVVGIDPLTGKLFTKQSSPSKTGKNLRKGKPETVFSEHMYDLSVGSSAIAEARAKAAAELSRFNQNAQGVVQGDPRIAPYKTVHVKGTGDYTDGFWIIKTAEHFMHHTGKYSVDFTCMTDGEGQNKESSFRKTPIENAAVRNVAYEMASSLPKKETRTSLSSKLPLIIQADNGLEIRQRRWVGK